ncbi:hypothetical protein ACLMJK_000380 [Lecanora helva]
MSAKILVASSQAACEARSSSLLPFLYNTRTLLEPNLISSRKASSLRQCTNNRSISPLSRHIAGYRRDLHTNGKLLDNDIFADRRSRSSPDRGLPFEDLVSEDEIPESKPSTITAAEKAVFDRIFQDLEKSSRDESKDVEEEDFLEGDEEMSTNPFEDLNSIFDAAIQQLKLKGQTKEARNTQKGPGDSNQLYRRAIEELDIRNVQAASARTFMRPLRLETGIVLGADAHLEENEQHLLKACEDHKDLVLGMFERAVSDVEIWEILEKEVFSLVKQLDANIKWEEKALKAKDKEARRAAKKQNMDTKKKAAHDADQASPTKAASPSPPKSIALPTTTLFSILQTNYADYLLSALRLLRRHHPTSFYPYYLLPTIHRLGPISYVLGASTNIYNEILFLKWTQFSDLHGMADLMQEMIDQGIGLNDVTKVFIGRLWSKRRYGRMGRMGVIVKAWWEMRGNVEGWRRVWGIFESAKREEREEREREALIAERGYEEN